MSGDKLSRSRSLVLARWRGAADVARERAESPAVHAPEAPEKADADAAELFRRFEAEVLAAVPAPMAVTLRRLLDAPRAAVSSEANPENYEKILAALDLVEDVLDAVLLTGAAASPGTETETENAAESP
jgi:hypothetical protein